ncbi:hypothetical protein [Candidatus Nitrospira salsa]
MSIFLMATATCLFFSVQGASTFGMGSDLNRQNQVSQESSKINTQQGMGSSIDTEPLSSTSKKNELERERKLRPGDAGKNGVTSVFGGHRTGSAATRNSGLNNKRIQ